MSIIKVDYGSLDGGGTILDTVINPTQNSYTDTGVSASDGIDKYILTHNNTVPNNYLGTIKITNNTIDAYWGIPYAEASIIANGNVGIKGTSGVSYPMNIIALKA